MKTTLHALRLLASALGILLLAGCTAPNAPAGPLTTPAPEVTAAPSPTPPATPASTPESSGEAASEDPYPTGTETDSLSFLTEEQQDLYGKAVELSIPLFSVPENLDGIGPFRPLDDGNGNWARKGDYSLYENSYAEWEDWMNSIFTPAYIQQLGRFYTDKFVDLDGHLATYFDTSLLRTLLPGYNRMVTENVSPLYRLESRTDKELTFTLLAPYDTNYRNSNTPQDMVLEWKEYPIRMVNTDDGWRIDEFHSAMYG